MLKIYTQAEDAGGKVRHVHEIGGVYPGDIVVQRTGVDTGELIAEYLSVFKVFYQLRDGIQCAAVQIQPYAYAGFPAYQHGDIVEYPVIGLTAAGRHSGGIVQFPGAVERDLDAADQPRSGAEELRHRVDQRGVGYGAGGHAVFLRVTQCP